MGFPLSSLLSGNFGSAAIGGVSSILGGALGYAYNKKLMRAQQEYNTSERLATQQYNTSEREAAQAYNTGEREAQNAYAEQMYNTYSSPEALVRQYEDAGLNPRLAIGSNTAGSVAASSGHSATVSPQSSGMLGITPPYQDVTSFSQGFVNIANSLKALAEAKNLGVDTDFAIQSLNDRLAGVKLSNVAQELQNSIQGVNLRYLPKEKAEGLSKLILDVSAGKITVDKLKEELKGLQYANVINKFNSENVVDRYTREMALVDSQRLKTENEAAVIGKTTPLVIEELQSRIAANYARAESLKADAELSKVNTGILSIQKEIQEYSKDEEMAYNEEYFFRQRQSLSVYQDILMERLKNAKKSNNYFELKMIGEMLGDIAQIGIAIGVNRKAKAGSTKSKSPTFKDVD